MSPMWRSPFVCDQWTGEVSAASHEPCDSHWYKFCTKQWLISLFVTGQTKVVVIFYNSAQFQRGLSALQRSLCVKSGLICSFQQTIVASFQCFPGFVFPRQALKRSILPHFGKVLAEVVWEWKWWTVTSLPDRTGTIMNVLWHVWFTFTEQLSRAEAPADTLP